MELFSSLTSPMVLAFILGIVATLLRSDLRFPDGMYMGLTIYLLFAIGLKGGVKLSAAKPAEIFAPGMAALFMCLFVPLLAFFTLRRLGGFAVPDAASVAGHFGSVSAVTFSEGSAFLEMIHVPAEGYMPAMLAFMEVPAILVAIFLARKFGAKEADGNTAGKKLMHELFTNKGTILLLGGIAAGLITGKKGFEQVAPVYDGMFRGVLCLFLLEVGLVTGRRLGDLKKVGPFLLAFGILMPVFNACLGIWLGHAAGLSLGGATLFGLLCASASYIAAPAAMRIALPESNPALPLTASLAVTFPFNVIIGLPLYLQIAKYIFK